MKTKVDARLVAMNAPAPHDLEPLARAAEKRDKARAHARRMSSALVRTWDAMDAGESLDPSKDIARVAAANDAKDEAEREWVATWKAAGSPLSEARS